MTTAPDNLAVANEIARQIGGRAFYMMGTQQKLGTENSLIFNVRGSKVNKVCVSLNSLDTYDIAFWTVPKGSRAIIRGEQPILRHMATDIYVDQLHTCIEEHTGLCLSL